MRVESLGLLLWAIILGAHVFYLLMWLNWYMGV